MKYLNYYITKTQFWIRLFGYGIAGKNLKYHRFLFSERYGYTKVFNILGWSFKLLKK